MKRVWLPLALVALSIVLASAPARAQTCSIGGHNETSEDFTPAGGWTLTNMTPGTVIGAPAGTHLVFSEVAPRGAGTGTASDSSEYIEIYNPTTRSIRLDDKYISDDPSYFRIVNGPYAVVNNTDWALRFPAGLSLSPGRTLVLCVTKAGFAGSGATAAGAQYFLEMKDSNGIGADDMIILTPNSTFPVTGGNLTNPSATNGEWVVLYCWNGSSDLVCDIDYASWGANSASNPKLDKTGISIDGPDAGVAVSAYNPDMAAAGQSNLGSSTVLAKPNTYQRVAGEVGEIAAGGNGCIGRAIPTVSWLPVAGTSNIRFQIRWTNPDEDFDSAPVSGSIASQEFGVFLPDYGQIGSFNVPPLQPSSFFDVFIELPLDLLPPKPPKILPGGGGGIQLARANGPSKAAFDCPPDTNWAGNVDIIWTAAGVGGQVGKHYADLLTCAGGPPSYIHFRGSNCPAPMPWSLVGVCPGWTVTLVNEDFTPAPNPVPVGWTGWICVSAAAVVPSGTNCCFGVVFQCNGQSSTIDICSTACDWEVRPPVLTTVDWTTLGSIVRFHQRWENPSATGNSDPVSGHMKSQKLGVFLPDYGPIGDFNVPPIAPSSFFDIFFDVARVDLPPEPTLQLPGSTPGVINPCVEDHWHGNVNIDWNGVGGTGQVFRHFGEVPVCPGAGPTYLFIETDCTSAVGASWLIAGLCPGFSATLVNMDSTAAPNPVPPGWIGMLCVSAPASTPLGTTCCFTVRFLCNGVPGVIEVCAKTCYWGPPKPVLAAVDWTRIGSNIRFHQHWVNNDASRPSDPVSGDMHSQPFGLYVTHYDLIGSFNVPPMNPSSFFDIFIDIPLSALPPEPEKRYPAGGPGGGAPASTLDDCPPDTSWSGNVDIMWGGPGGSGQVNRHFTGLLVRPGSGSSHVHALIFCNDPAGATWSIAGLCPGWSAALLNENFTPAPNPVPPGWTGWISVAAGPGVPAGASCCFTVTFSCDGVPGVIDVCAEACLWPVTGVPGDWSSGLDFGIGMTAPNPTSGEMLIGYALPRSGRAELDIYNLGGQRVRSLFDGESGAGPHSIRWDGRGENRRALPPGAYFVRLKLDSRVAIKRIVLLR